MFKAALDQHYKGKLEDAVQGYGRALAINPRHVGSHNCMAAALRQQGKLDAAIACYKQSLVIQPNDPSAQSCLGDVLREAGHLGPSLIAHQRAVKMKPLLPEAIYRMGLALRDLGQATSAVSCFEKALLMKPDFVDCRYAHALSLLRIGEYKKGFVEFEWRWKLPGNRPRRYKQPLWDGSDLTGRTILLHQEQTFGDMIQFIRYALPVKKKGGAVVVECQPELARLFLTAPGVDKVVSTGDALPDFDVYAPMLSLPRILKTTMATIPADIPYLSRPVNHDIHIPVPKGVRLMVGIAWSGSPANAYDRHRSCPLDGLLRLLSRAGIAVYSLQKGEAAGQLAESAHGPLVADLGGSIHDFADTAAIISQLDLIITVDTAAAHLAGAMGHPVWVLLPFSAGWRWLGECDESPWYPGDRLFRQSRPGRWEDVFADVEKALTKLLGG
ncbi:MAG: hypothetical protein A3G18_11310 [Rhodospirillales bacterium RIFCSPLOWO2_12_FULL_58_28]|nr:MAG: hypothetical protein A3H92_10455 [Rhodospirillales bacterium RIFCSPLOWO2_02_FULL_58_16]OHC77833.1 MAG: hypothetical protein A3G18_11310 [Rhodospirillales bacterium RIFCSPLOWO2_12_FULL_58_28]